MSFATDAMARGMEIAAEFDAAASGFDSAGALLDALETRLRAVTVTVAPPNAAPPVPRVTRPVRHVQMLSTAWTSPLFGNEFDVSTSAYAESEFSTVVYGPGVITFVGGPWEVSS